MACGKSGENIIPNKIQLKIGDYIVVEQGKESKDYNEDVIKQYMKWDSLVIELNLNIGNAAFTVYTCDLTREYVEINAFYN